MNAERLFEAVAGFFEATPDAAVFYDTSGCIIDANDAACELVGYSREELVGQPYSAFARYDDERVRQAIEVARTGGSDHFEASAKRKDGTIVPVETYVFAVSIDGQVAGIFSQSRDIVALRSAEESLGINQDRFRSLFEYHPDGIMELKAAGAISRVNVALESETGYYGEQIVGRFWTDLIAPESRGEAEESFRSVMRGEAVEHDSNLLDRLGNRVLVQLKLVPLRVRDEISGAYAIFKDVTAQKNAEKLVVEQNDRIRRLYMVAAAQDETVDRQIEAMLALGLDLFHVDVGYVTKIEGARLRVMAASGDPAISRNSVYPLEQTISRHLAGERRILSIHDIRESEFRHDPAATAFPWRSYLALSLRVGGEFYGTLVFASLHPRVDVTGGSELDLLQLMGLFVVAALERGQQNERIEHLAFNDVLTGLPNRVLFLDRISRAIATAKRYERGFSVMYLDLDHFKEINDRYGHAAGDHVLAVVGERLRTALRESDTVARFGGDEFVILQPIVDGPADAADLAQKVSMALEEPIVVDGVEHRVRASIGVALYPGDAEEVEQLMELADRALYRAKSDGRDRWVFVDPKRARGDLKKQRPPADS
jgi:diguanylate cyclase (GGDEF)-like protein/PAS domain S-box-containing protein